MKISKLNEFALLREQSGLSVDEIAEATGSTIRTVYRWEKGESRANKLVLDLLKEKAYEYKPQPRSSPKFTFIDLFAGIGGMRIAFEKIGGDCIYTSEWDSHAVKTYLANFPSTHRIDGDINLVCPEDIPKHDVLLAGFPCQPFSIAGVSKKNALGKPHGFRDKTQGTLFFKIAEILNYHKPKVFLLENVKNLRNHDKGNTYKIISETLKELGYHFDSIILDAKAYVPQHRERIFIAGFRDNNNFSFDKLKLPSEELGPKLRDILHTEDGSQIPEPPYTYGDSASVSEKYILTTHLWNYLRSYADRHRAKGNGFGFGLVDSNQTARTLSARYYKDGSEILIKRGKKLPRRLTPRECSRLMGFDSKDRIFKIPVSDTQAYKQFGNAVVVPVVEAVAKYMLPFLIKSK